MSRFALRTLSGLALVLGIASPALAQEASGTDQSPGMAAAPPVPHDRAADRLFDPVAMARAEMAMMHESQGRFSAARIDLAEHDFRRGTDGSRWEGEVWTGDTDRWVLASRGETGAHGRLDNGEAEALYTHALTPWWNLEGGIRQDFGIGPQRTHAMMAIEGTAPMQITLSVALFLSDKGQASGRAEVWFDERLTRRLILQPRAELNFASADLPGQHLGAGLGNGELGLRLRYEITRRFAPYAGLSWLWTNARTDRLAGEAMAPRSVVVGVKAWF